MRVPSGRLVSAALLVVSACGRPAEPVDGTRDAAVLGPVLECDPPVLEELSPSTSTANAGVLTAGVAWTIGRCELVADETLPEVVLVVADFEGALGLGTVAAANGDWIIESSDLSSSPTTYIHAFSYGEQVSMVLEKDGTRIAMTILVQPGLLVLLDMRLV